jgi:hypothetical protein
MFQPSLINSPDSSSPEIHTSLLTLQAILSGGKGAEGNFELRAPRDRDCKSRRKEASRLHNDRDSY